MGYNKSMSTTALNNLERENVMDIKLITHTTLKDAEKKVTGYEIKVDGAKVGDATKTPKGKFTFTGVGSFKIEGEQGTMRDLKVAVSKLPGLAEFVAANKPVKEPKAPKPTKDAATTADGATAAQPPAPQAPAEGDLDIG